MSRSFAKFDTGNSTLVNKASPSIALEKLVSWPRLSAVPPMLKSVPSGVLSRSTCLMMTPFGLCERAVLITKDVEVSVTSSLKAVRCRFVIISMLFRVSAVSLSAFFL